MWLSLVIFAVIASLIGLLVYGSKKRGKLEARNAQQGATLDAINRGNNARDSLHSLHDDPNNRDTLRDSETD